MQLQDKFNVNISRRHKHSNMEDHKEEKDLDKLAFHGIDTETLEDGSHSQRSQRSQQSSQTTTQRSDRTVKKMNINNINDSSLVLQQTKQSHAGKSIVALRRLDQGDGDASKISTPANHYASAAVTPLPLLDQSKTDTFSTEYEDDYENDEETEETPESEDEEHVENSKEELGDGDGRYMSNVDGRPVEDDLFEENVDYFKEQHRVEVI